MHSEATLATATTMPAIPAESPTRPSDCVENVVSTPIGSVPRPAAREIHPRGSGRTAGSGETVDGGPWRRGGKPCPAAGQLVTAAATASTATMTNAHRQPTVSATAGTASPATRPATGAADCFAPRAVPRNRAGTSSTSVRLLVGATMP